MARLSPGATTTIRDFPADPGVLADFEFKRIDVYAPGTRIIVVDAHGQHEVPRSQRVHLLGYSKDGRSRVGLSYDPDLLSEPYGAGSGPSGAFVLRSEHVSGGWRFHAVSAESALPAGTTPEFTANEDSLPNPDAAPATLDHLIDLQSPSGTLRNAVVAVDTDTTFMSKRFAGNTTQATAWIADLFAQMNVMYERDLDVHLQQGTTFLRTASDPFANNDSSATSAMLNEFGTYWQNNYSSGSGTVGRAFAMLLSGNSSSGNSASGIAWVNAYCRTNSSGGSYSTNQIFTNPAIGVALSAFIVGHELGHNFGASHTHCTNSSSGSAPTGSNTIDQCYSGESGCYSGPVSCPTGTPEAPKGTVMSYCHVSSASCGQNVQVFHPTHITVIRNRVAANTPSCLTTSVDLIFANGFQ
ncbi:M12 family metallo-peptidase [Dokdonella immobilis]|uniref:M12 family metallo-peptidase n=1 Tax=Dokdonella immobilis TaxID=578942 RepID=UPI00158798D4|nr:M12 family metallo-peptidase [Dokdonella immobilis]